jgi:ubiquinone/menaquinone biosynthesis C-methylase UbiE
MPMQVSWLRWLCCPFCGGSFSPSAGDRGTGELDYAVLSCHCSHYPVVAGIPILQHGPFGGARHTVAEVIALIQTGRHREALLALLAPYSRALAWLQRLAAIQGLRRLDGLAAAWGRRRGRQQVAALWPDHGSLRTACAALEGYFRQGGRPANYHYFAFRFAHPRYLAALAFTNLLHQPGRPLLDLACGCGHLLHHLAPRAAGQSAIGVDTSFLGLYMAKHWIAPAAEYVCCTADTALPFPDGTFAAVFCSDAFQYVVNKATCMRELRRLTQPAGFMVLNALPNARLQDTHALLKRTPYRRPLSPEGYQQLVADMPHCLVATRDVLGQYLHKHGPELKPSGDLTPLADAPFVSLVASHRPEVFRAPGPFDTWPHAEGCLGVNPLYVHEDPTGPGTVRLRRTFPSRLYALEYADFPEYLPEAVEVRAEIFTDLAQGKRPPELEELLEQCVVLGMPPGYQ